MVFLLLCLTCSYQCAYSKTRTGSVAVVIHYERLQNYNPENLLNKDINQFNLTSRGLAKFSRLSREIQDFLKTYIVNSFKILK